MTSMIARVRIGSVAVFSLIAGLMAGVPMAARPAFALSIELKDVAADRVDRQRAAAEGALPLPGTPNVAILEERLREKGVSLNTPMLIRVFKSESELEVWKEINGSYVLFATYPICHWSGSVGPKLRDGDKQAPEGYYTVSRKQLQHVGRWPKSLYLNYPNIFDQSQARTGNLILIHGGCTSVGCFAMTNPVMDEIHRLSVAAIESGQEHIPVHVFPFRMTKDNWETHERSPWQAFWVNLKEGYDQFEKSKLPPRVSVCDGRYKFSPATSARDSGPLEACGDTIATIRDQEEWLENVPSPGPIPVRTAAATMVPASPGSTSVTDANFEPMPAPAELAPAVVPEVRAIRCRFALRSCGRYLTLQNYMAAKRAALMSSGLRRYKLTAKPELVKPELE